MSKHSYQKVVVAGTDFRLDANLMLVCLPAISRRLCWVIRLPRERISLRIHHKSNIMAADTEWILLLFCVVIPTP